MSRHDLHRQVTKFLLGDSLNRVHTYMDEPSWSPKWRLGRYHRRVRHNPIWTSVEVFLIEWLTQKYPDWRVVPAVVVHIYQDNFDSAIGLTKIIDKIKKENKKKRKRKKR